MYMCVCVYKYIYIYIYVCVCVTPFQMYNSIAELYLYIRIYCNDVRVRDTVTDSFEVTNGL